MNEATFAEDFKELMNNWDTIKAKVAEKYPGATPEQQYEICVVVMCDALSL